MLYYADSEDFEYDSEDIEKIELIQNLWNSLEGKSNPVNAIIGTAKRAALCLADCRSYDNMNELDRCIKNFSQYTGYFKELYGQDSECEELQEKIYEMMRDGYELMEMELEGYDGEEMYMASEYKGRPASKQMQIIYETIPLYEETALRFIDRISTEKSKENDGNEHDTNSLENKSFEELMEIVAKNDATISQNEDLMKKALIKRILGQQQKIAEQKEEIARLREQKVM